MVPALICLALFFMGCKTVAQTKTVYNLVTDFGAVGDNRTNNYGAFKRAAATLSGSKNKQLLIPKGIYYIADYKIHGGSRQNNITNILFSDVKGLSIQGNGSTIRLNGKFKRSADYKQSGVTYDYAYNNTVCPLAFANSKAVKIENLQLLGGANEMEKTEGVVEGNCYGIMLLDLKGQESEDFTINNVHLKYFATDGLYIAARGKNIKITNSSSHNNGRQGLSIVKGRNVLVSNSQFDSTGFTGKYGSHSPAAGIDVENEGEPEQLDNISIVNCSFRHNQGFQLVSTATSGKVAVDSCYFEDRLKGYGTGFNSVGLYSRNSGISNSIIYGMLQLETAHETYRGSEPIYIRNNIIYSGSGGLLSSDYNTPITITGNIIIMLPKPLANQFFPFVRNTNAEFSSNVIITHEEKFKVQQSRITGLMQGVKKTDNNVWLLAAGVDKKLSRSPKPDPGYYTIAYDGTKTVGRQYYPNNIKNSMARSAEKNFLDDNLIEQIFQKGIFTKYNQYKYDKSLISDAAAIRDLLQRNMR